MDKEDFYRATRATSIGTGRRS